MISSLYIEKTYGKIQNPSMIKNTQQNQNRRELLQPDKEHLLKKKNKKPTVNIMLNDQKAFSLKIRNKTRIFILATSI